MIHGSEWQCGDVAGGGSNGDDWRRHWMHGTERQHTGEPWSNWRWNRKHVKQTLPGYHQTHLQIMQTHTIYVQWCWDLRQICLQIYASVYLDNLMVRWHHCLLWGMLRVVGNVWRKMIGTSTVAFRRQVSDSERVWRNARHYSACLTCRLTATTAATVMCGCFI